ncbi:MAG: hypothetical protein ACREPA_08600 [Candidatus Dormibacteraceae bacterium]
MILFLLALAAALAGVGSYSYFNQGTVNIHWWAWHWYGVPDWWPVAAATAALFLILVLYMAFAGWMIGRSRGSDRMVAAHDVAIDDLRRENLALHDEVTRLRAEAPATRREMA